MERKNELTSSLYEKAFRSVLHHYRIPNYAFSIGKPAEQRVCLVKNGNQFTVFMVERGMRFEESQFESEDEAYLEMLHHLAPTKEAFYEMQNAYTHQIETQQIARRRGLIPTNNKVRIAGLKVACKSPVSGTTSIAGTNRTRSFKSRIISGHKDSDQRERFTVRFECREVSNGRKSSARSPQNAEIGAAYTGRAGFSRHSKVYRRSVKHKGKV